MVGRLIEQGAGAGLAADNPRRGIAKVDTVLQLSVESATTTAQPGAPADGAAYIIPTGKTGAQWAGFTVGQVAVYRGTTFTDLAASGYWEALTPNEGWSCWVRDTDKQMIYNAGAWADAPWSAGALTGFKNRLANGCFRINQRAPASNADDTYCVDRWNVLTQTGAIATAILTGDENGATSYLRTSQSQATPQRLGVSQIIEHTNCRDLRGKNVTFSGRVRCGSSQAFGFAILAWTGTADAVTSDVVNDWTNGTFTTGNFFISTTTSLIATAQVTPAATWTSFVVSGAVPAGMNNLIVIMWSVGTVAQWGVADFNRCQLEEGLVASPFEIRPLQIELDLALRYYEKSFALATTPAQNVGAANGEHRFGARAGGAVFNMADKVRFRVRKRATPTMTLYNPAAANAQIRDLSANADFSGSGASPVDTDGFVIFGTGNASTSNTNICGAHWTADAEL